MSGPSMAEDEYYPRQSTIRTGLRCACPRCGVGKLYDGLLRVRDRCEHCALDYSRLEADDGPAFFIIVGYSALIIPLALWLEFAATPPIWVHALIWIPVVIIGSVLLLRPLKAWLVAQHYAHRVHDEA